VTASEEGRWADAVAHFELAYSVSGLAPALFNLAFAQRALGRHRDARDSFRRLFERHESELDATMSDEARILEREVARRVVRVEVRGLDDDETYDVRLDGHPVADGGERPFVIEVDAGHRVLHLSLPGYEPFLWEGDPDDGEQVEIDATLARRGSDGEGFIGSTEFWIIVGAAAGGALLAAGVLVQNNLQLDPESGKVYEL
jgi:hypothetical protein